MPSIAHPTPGTAMAKRRWHLTDELVTEKLMVAQAHASMRALASSPNLSGRLRTECARLALHLGRLGRDLAAFAQQVAPTGPDGEAWQGGQGLHTLLQQAIVYLPSKSPSPEQWTEDVQALRYPTNGAAPESRP
jgi:hypothetical protein